MFTVINFYRLSDFNEKEKPGPGWEYLSGGQFVLADMIVANNKDS